MTNLTTIIAGLTDAQKECLIRQGKGYFVPQTYRSLERKGLWKSGALTPLGLAVRAELEKMDG